MRRISGIKPFVLFFILALLVTGGVIWYFSSPQITHQSRGILTPNPEISYSFFSLSGMVVKSTDTGIIFTTQVLMQTDAGNVAQARVKTALITDKTVFLTSAGKPASLKNIKPGEYINVFYASDPTLLDQAPAEKIVIQ